MVINATSFGNTVQKLSTVLVLDPRLFYIGLHEGNKGLHLPNGLQFCKDYL